MDETDGRRLSVSEQDTPRVHTDCGISPVGMSWEDWKSAALAKDDLMSLTLLLRAKRIFAKIRCMENE